MKKVRHLPDLLLAIAEQLERLVIIREAARSNASLRRYEPMLTSAIEHAKVAIGTNDDVTCLRALERMERLPNPRAFTLHLKRVA